VKHLPGEPINW